MSNLTEQEKPVAFTRVYSGDPPEDVEMEDPDSDTDQQAISRHFTVSIDFGTTFSSVSFIALDGPETKRHIHPNQICSIEHYPDAPLASYEQRREVPTESWYPKTALRNDVGDDEPLKRDTGLTPDESSGEDDDSSQLGSQHEIIRIDTPPDSGDDEADDESSKEYFWGYGVQKQLEFPDMNRAQSRRIAKSKLLLDASPQTAEIRTKLNTTLQVLKKMKVIKEDNDVIADFLEHLFRHTKQQLARSHGFHVACSVEFVLCVPAIWTRKACRIMQTAMATAISRSGFGAVDSGSVDNLFIVSEPEAAAAYVLEADTDDVLVSDTLTVFNKES
jgi:hypothetical protein